MQIAILDDWQGLARQSADWSALERRAELVFFANAFTDEDAAAAALAAFDIVMPMRERTAFPESLIARLPKLKLVSMTGKRAATFDLKAMAKRGIVISYAESGDNGEATAELALGLMLAAARAIPHADATIRAGGFQTGVPEGQQLAGKTLGVIGLGRLGSRMARYALAMDMKVLAWSQNLTAEHATAKGVQLASKEQLLVEADVVSLHLVLSPRSRGIIGADELARMKHGAILINTSRGPLIDEAALLAAVGTGRITAALDVYDREPLPPAHPFRTMPGLILTPHLGYCTAEAFRAFYAQGIENVLAFLDGAPIRVLNPA
jgi:phosphoglycerate dehydrogenase-like enzyme